MPIISLIAAIGEHDGALGFCNDLPWSRPLPPDMQFFKQKTLYKPVVMGRRTWESIPARFRPLRDRVNIVVTRNEGAQFPGAHAAFSVIGALQLAEHHCERDGEIMVIGGDSVYRDAFAHAHRLYLTLVDEKPMADRYFPADYKKHFPIEVSREVMPEFVPRLTFVTLEKPDVS